jgi:hypothetical protein
MSKKSNLEKSIDEKKELLKEKINLERYSNVKQME